jgi:hypothetical protein
VSNSLAIAAVTATLRNLLFQGLNADLAGTDVTTRPPDRARVNENGNQLNLFLYQTQLSAAWRNMELPGTSRPGETSAPPLPLTLAYLITAYGENDDEVLSNRLLGRAMSVLHDHSLLGADEVRRALEGNDLHEQVERVRITPQPLTLEELSKLWATFQTQYRVSASYQASVVLIESTLPPRAPTPVLRRGARADELSGFPLLEELVLPGRRPSARPGETLRLRGRGLAGPGLVVRIRLSRPVPPLAAPQPPVVSAGPTELIVTPASAGPTEVEVVLPELPEQVPAGLHALSVGVTWPDEAERLSNELALPVAPRITSPLPMTVARGADGTATIALDCSPRVLPSQRAYLLLGDRQLAAAPHPQPTDSLTFVVRGAEPGSWLARLRVDGVDGLPIEGDADPPTFDESRRITIT